MTYEEVKQIRNNPTLDDVDNEELSKMLDEAVEKQIPRKIDNKDEADLVYGCHCCGEINALWKMNGDKNKYCGNCGQKIDWGDEE